MVDDLAQCSADSLDVPRVDWRVVKSVDMRAASSGSKLAVWMVGVLADGMAVMLESALVVEKDFLSVDWMAC